MTALTFDATAVREALAQAEEAARQATTNFLARHGERDACGFSWVTVSKVRSNSKLGKALAEAGFSKSYTGGLQLWNPSGNPTQAITAKEVGANAYASILREKLGIEAYAESRMD
jgi:hypothetical protein